MLDRQVTITLTVPADNTADDPRLVSVAHRQDSKALIISQTNDAGMWQNIKVDKSQILDLLEALCRCYNAMDTEKDDYLKPALVRENPYVDLVTPETPDK